MPGTTSSAAENLIYLIADEHEYESGNGYWTEEYADPEYGYFTDLADAMTFVQERNDERYARQIEAAEREFDKHKTSVRRQQDEYDTLVKAGRKPSFWRPTDPKPYTPPRRHDTLSIVEVEPA